MLSDYLNSASQKIALEYVDSYYDLQVNTLKQFVDAFDENLADNLIKAQELMQSAGVTSSGTTDQGFNLSIPLDLGIGEMAGTSVAAAKVIGAVSQVWAANPDLSYAQIKEILRTTAIDLNASGWDRETGSGLVNLESAVERAKQTQPEDHNPTPLLSPLTWSGTGIVTPSERPVLVTVPAFNSQLLRLGYVSQTNSLRIRSGPGTNYREVGLKYPGEVVSFDAYEDNGGWVPDPNMPGGRSRRWYRIAGTNQWMSGLYFDNSPEQAAQERQRQEAIRRAEEEARRAEEALRLAQKEARRAEEERSLRTMKGMAVPCSTSARSSRHRDHSAPLPTLDALRQAFERFLQLDVADGDASADTVVTY